MKKQEIRFRPRDRKASGTVSQSILPYLLAGSLGLGGGGLGTTLLKPTVTPEHIQRLEDALERAVQRIEDKFDEVEKRLDDLEDKVEDLY